MSMDKNGSLMQRGSFTQSMMLVRAVSRFGKKSSEACIAQSQLIAANSYIYILYIIYSYTCYLFIYIYIRTLYLELELDSR